MAHNAIYKLFGIVQPFDINRAGRSVLWFDSQFGVVVKSWQTLIWRSRLDSPRFHMQQLGELGLVTDLSELLS